jgi:membrane protein
MNTLNSVSKKFGAKHILFFFFARVLPAPAFEVINQTLNQIIQSHGPLKISLGDVISLWSASAGMTAIMDTLNSAYAVKETRSFFKQYAVAIALTFALAALIVVSTLSVIVGNRIVGSLGNQDAVMAWKIAIWPLAAALMLLGFALTYYFAPDVKDRKWSWITPGAVLGLIILALAWVGFRVYLPFSNVSTAYGSLGGVIVLLLSFYLCGIAVLSGGVLNCALQKVTKSRRANVEV